MARAPHSSFRMTTVTMSMIIRKFLWFWCTGLTLPMAPAPNPPSSTLRQARTSASSGPARWGGEVIGGCWVTVFRTVKSAFHFHFYHLIHSCTFLGLATATTLLTEHEREVQHQQQGGGFFILFFEDLNDQLKNAGRCRGWARLQGGRHPLWRP